VKEFMISIEKFIEDKEVFRDHFFKVYA